MAATLGLVPVRPDYSPDRTLLPGYLPLSAGSNSVFRFDPIQQAPSSHDDTATYAD